MAAEVDEFAIGHVERMILTRVSACLYSEGVVSWLERFLDRFMAFDRADAPAIHCDLECAASELDAGPFPRQPER